MVIGTPYNFLFWNVNRKGLYKEIKEIVEGYKIDILILAELPDGNEGNLLLKLNDRTSDFYPQHPISNCQKIKILTRFHFDFIPPIFEDHRMTIRKIEFPVGLPLLLAAIHFPDKGSFSNDSQEVESSIVIEKIKEVESDCGILRTIVVGDFNMNPFEKGMVMTTGFHSTMSSALARKKHRVVQTKNYDFFYNPMWNLYGDLYSNTISGTYYYPHAEHVSYHWNIYDQILLRPELIDNFEKGSLRILETTSIKSLLTGSNIPDQKNFSDHLPIIFTLKI